MTVILQGSLRHFPPWQLLPFLVCSVESATFDVSGDTPLRIVFRGGRAVSGSSSEGNDAVTAAAMLLDNDGTFTVDDAVDATVGDGPGLEISELLEASAKRAREIAYGDAVVFRVVDDPAVQESITLSPDEFRLVLKIGQGRSIGDLASASNTERADLVALLKGLETHGLIVRVVPDKPAPAAATGAATAAAGATQKVPPITAPPASPPPVTTPLTAPQRPSQTDVKTVFGSGEDGDKTVIDGSPWLPLKTGEMPAPPAAAPPKKKRTGSLTADPPDGTVYALIDDEYTIGREPGNSIVIVDGSVSSKHALISRNAEGWIVKDLGSRNGTYVNGEPVKSKETRPLADNDILRLGKVILTFNVAGDIAPSETTEHGVTT